MLIYIQIQLQINRFLIKMNITRKIIEIKRSKYQEEIRRNEKAKRLK